MIRKIYAQEKKGFDGVLCFNVDPNTYISFFDDAQYLSQILNKEVHKCWTENGYLIYLRYSNDNLNTILKGADFKVCIIVSNIISELI